MNPAFSHSLQYGLLRATAAVVSLLPRRIRSAAGAVLGHVLYLLGIRGRITRGNIAAAFPGLPEVGVRQIAARVYRHFGRVAFSFLDLKNLQQQDIGRWIHVEGFEVLESVLREGKGGIVFSGHLGNWELMGAAAARCGYPVTFVVAAQSNELVEELIDRYRRSAGIEIIKRRDAIRGVLSALKRNRLVAMLIDQDAHEDGVFVPFFGRPASTPRGPAVLSLRSGAPLIFAHGIRLRGDHYRIRFSRLLPEKGEDADQMTARMTAMLEAAIRQTPEQWFWMHRRWKTRPSVS